MALLRLYRKLPSETLPQRLRKQIEREVRAKQLTRATEVLVKKALHLT